MKKILRMWGNKESNLFFFFLNWWRIYFSIFYLKNFLWPHLTARGNLCSLTRHQTHALWKWKCGILTTGPPGKSKVAIKREVKGWNEKVRYVKLDPRRWNRENGTEAITENILPENYLELMKDMHLSIQQIQNVPVKKKQHFSQTV